MALKITEDCASCGVCEPECPNKAISEGDDRYVIDPAKCTECVGFHDEPQCSSVCPVEACVKDPAHAESNDQLVAKKKQLHGE